MMGSLRGLRVPHGQVTLWLLLGCLVAGCSSGEVSTLKGQVTFGGEPLADGTIRLVPQAGATGQGAAGTITNGSYEIAGGAGLTPGKYQVVIAATREATPEEAAARQTGEEEENTPNAEGEVDKGDSAPKVQLIPAKYNLRSELTLDVVAGENTKDFALEK